MAGSQSRGIVGNVGQRLTTAGDAMLHRYRKLSRRGKITFWSLFLFNGLVIAAIFIITPHRIGEWFNDLATEVRSMGAKGVVICCLAVVATSHPPLFGFSPSMMLIGFAYGLWPGFLIGAVSSLIGGALAFISIRTFFLDWMRSFGSSRNKQWEAFGHVMRDKGWTLVTMIRWCPIPWAIGNGLFASIEAVKFWQFMLANVLFLPRLFIPIFIGSRLTSFTDGRSEPDPARFWLNLVSIGASISISATTGIVIYRLTLRQMRKLEHGHPGDLEDGELAASALEHTALLGDYSDEEELVPRTRSPRQRVGAGAV